MIRRVERGVVRFGSHILDPGTGSLRQGRRSCALQSQPAQLLVFLVERAGEIVTRDEIRRRLWPGSVVPNDQNINFAIRQIRLALGADACMIQTIPRHGYRFVGLLQSDPVGVFPASPLAMSVAVSLVLALSVGFGIGIIMRDGPTGQFVYDHLVHPDRCPYIRMLLPTHRNS